MMYTGAHAITFETPAGEEYNTWTTWHLVPLERPSVAPPEVNAPLDGSFKDPFGAVNLSLLWSDFNGGVVSRTGSWSFYIENGHDTWSNVYSSIMSALHGKKLYVTLDDDEDYIYFGRIKVKDFKSEKSYSSVTIEYLLEPYKYGEEAQHVVIDRQQSETFVVAGNYYTPAIVTVSAYANVTSLNINGLSTNPITRAMQTTTIQNLLPSHGTITIDGDTKKALRIDPSTHEQINVFGDADPQGPGVYLWAFPMLKNGTNHISLDSDQIRLEISYRERYL